MQMRELYPRNNCRSEYKIEFNNVPLERKTKISGIIITRRKGLRSTVSSRTKDRNRFFGDPANAVLYGEKKKKTAIIIGFNNNVLKNIKNIIITIRGIRISFLREHGIYSDGNVEYGKSCVLNTLEYVRIASYFDIIVEFSTCRQYARIIMLILPNENSVKKLQRPYGNIAHRDAVGVTTIGSKRRSFHLFDISDKVEQKKKTQIQNRNLGRE